MTPHRIVSLSLLLLSACADEVRTQPSDDDQDAASSSSAGGSSSSGAACPPAGLAGSYLFTLSIYLDAASPFLFATELSAEAGSLALTLQPLDKSDRATPVGPPVAVGPCPIDSSGAFSCSLPGVTLVAAANPLTCADVTADIAFAGSVCAGPLLCGQLTGVTTSMIDLAGSTFTLERLAAPGVYPELPTIDCAGQLANPLPTGCQ